MTEEEGQRITLGGALQRRKFEALDAIQELRGELDRLQAKDREMLDALTRSARRQDELEAERETLIEVNGELRRAFESLAGYNVAEAARVESNVSIGDRRLTWKQLVEHQGERMATLQEKAGLWDDLDRCEHGRHKGDDCTLVGGCGGPSHGNPIAQDGVLGYTLGGKPIVHPYLHPAPQEGE